MLKALFQLLFGSFVKESGFKKEVSVIRKGKRISNEAVRVPGLLTSYLDLEIPITNNDMPLTDNQKLQFQKIKKRIRNSNYELSKYQYFQVNHRKRNPKDKRKSLRKIFYGTQNILDIDPDLINKEDFHNIKKVITKFFKNVDSNKSAIKNYEKQLTTAKEKHKNFLATGLIESDNARKLRINKGIPDKNAIEYMNLDYELFVDNYKFNIDNFIRYGINNDNYLKDFTKKLCIDLMKYKFGDNQKENAVIGNRIFYYIVAKNFLLNNMLEEYNILLNSYKESFGRRELTLLNIWLKEQFIPKTYKKNDIDFPRTYKKYIGKIYVNEI